MTKTYKYRLYPNKKTKRELNKTLNSCRETYNYILNIKNSKYEKDKTHLSKYDVDKIITQYKKEKEELKLIHSQILQNVSDRADKAYKNFFRRIKKGDKPGFPRFKGINRYDSFTLPQNNGSFKIIDDKWLQISKIGKIKINLHREIEGKIKSCIIKKTKTHKWYAYFISECDLNILPTNNKKVGIDVGIKTFAYCSDDNVVKNPRILKHSEKKLKKYQSKFSKQPKRSEKRKKYGKILTKIHEKIKNQRENFLHQESRKIVNKYQIICMEDLTIKSMIKKDKTKDNLEQYKDRLRNKNILDACWDKFINNIIYKAEEAGRTISLVDPRYTSQMCSRCGHLVPKELNDRIHRCDKCGLVMDRDKNSSITILRLGLESLEVMLLRSPRIYSGE